ncbi:NB-ARC domain-containing protein [Streptomyces sp. Li-HN-5-11]|uniref:NB-ARC domain-containing protein n=1 Tax=Streptomyces sp. Li-HN-5-11 TaxID=3075432 RepID=UPI0028ACBF5F|nr:NB-ARC domain-containing protein [Streptomyces sp. Li-HN-5-11]WNM33421.1 NB-ARC domain-containing protein [Streptomyces sp. Li-HN-5-11]
MCRKGRTVGITTSLWGAGGFGKTTLAMAVCAHGDVQRRFNSRIYVVTVGRDVRGRAAVAAKVAEVTRFVTGDATEYTDPDLAGAHLGRLLDQRPRTLLVLDDVWEEEQLAPFLQGGRRCVRLVTTRNPGLLPPRARRIQVDQMSKAQAASVLTWQLPLLDPSTVDGLLQVTGRWALLLRLTNRLIAEQVSAGADLAVTAERVLHQLRTQGPAALDDVAATWDLDDPRRRNEAVRASVEAATTLLPSGSVDRFAELGIFAEDESIPVSVVVLLWGASSGLTEHQTRALLGDLARLSLLTLDGQDGGRISLHDVVRDYLRRVLGTAGVARLNALMVDAVAATLPVAQPLGPGAPEPGRAWWQTQDGYLLDHLVSHLLAAGRTTTAEAVAGDLRWVEARLVQRGPSAPWNDLTRINTVHAGSLARTLAQASHLLRPTIPPRSVVSVLHSRLRGYPHWDAQIGSRENDPALRPCLVTQWPLPDVPHAALQRTLADHRSAVRSVAIAPDGTWLATGGDDKKVRIWDRASGTCTTVLTGHRDAVGAVAIAPDGTWLATGGDDKKVRIWDRASGTCTTVLTGHRGAVRSVAIAPDGTWLATGGDDKKVRIWDRASGTCTTVLTGHRDAVRAVAIAPNGTWLATASDDAKVRIWDRSSGACTATLAGHGGPVSDIVIALDGTWFATGGDDGKVRIWDRSSGVCTGTLTGHSGPVRAVAVAPDGTWLATASDDTQVRIWDRFSGACTATLTGHSGPVRAVAVAPDGTWLATASDDETGRLWDRGLSPHAPSRPAHTRMVRAVAVASDGTWLATGGDDKKVRIWDRASGTCTTVLTGHRGAVRSVAIAPDGTWLATGGDDTEVRIWDRSSGICTSVLTGHSAPVRDIAIAPDGSWLATVGAAVKIWDRTAGTCVRTFRGTTRRYQYPAYSVAIDPSGARLVAGFANQVSRSYSYPSGGNTWIFLTGALALTTVFAPDGSWFAIGDKAGQVTIWDNAINVRTTSFQAHSGAVRSVAVSRNSRWLATVGADTTVRIWDVAAERTLALARADGALHSCAWGPQDELLVGGERGLYLFAFLT